jgi:hypothetical protein
MESCTSRGGREALGAKDPVTGSPWVTAAIGAKPSEREGEENLMRTIILRGVHRIAPDQPRVIDVTPTVASIGRSWRQRARMGLSVLLAVVMLPMAWLVATVTALVLVGLGALAVAVVGLRLWRQRAMSAGDERIPWTP